MHTSPGRMRFVLLCTALGGHSQRENEDHLIQALGEVEGVQGSSSTCPRAPRWSQKGRTHSQAPGRWASMVPHRAELTLAASWTLNRSLALGAHLSPRSEESFSVCKTVFLHLFANTAKQCCVPGSTTASFPLLTSGHHTCLNGAVEELAAECAPSFEECC